MPRFSVVIPVFNRERELRRALESCLAQDHSDFEVVVVDDGSTDATRRSFYDFADSRFRLVGHSSNRGQGPARNTGMRNAAGDWVVSMDSDDELLPGALTLMEQELQRFGGAVERLAFSFERDDGRRSPLPIAPDQTLDYGGYLTWLENRELYDFLPCTRRDTFETVQWREQRWTDHCLYNLDFAARFRTRFCSAAAAQVHLDAATRISYRRREPEIALEAALELGKEMDSILQRHGAALRQFAPKTYGTYMRMRAAQHYLAGDRRRGLLQSLIALRAAPFSAEAWGMPLLGLSGARLFAGLRACRPPMT